MAAADRCARRGVGFDGDVAQRQDPHQLLSSIENDEPADLQGLHALERGVDILVLEGIGRVDGHAFAYGRLGW